MDHRHLWLRSGRQRAIARVRNEIEQAIHDFFYERGFLRVDTPILTAAIGERSGLFSTEYFDEGNAYLAQTGQLYGEAVPCGAKDRRRRSSATANLRVLERLRPSRLGGSRSRCDASATSTVTGNGMVLCPAWSLHPRARSRCRWSGCRSGDLVVLRRRRRPPCCRGTPRSIRSGCPGSWRTRRCSSAATDSC